MPDWTVEREFIHQGLTITVKREAGSRWPDRMLSARRTDGEVYWERVDNARWQGHADGQLFIPGFLGRAAAHLLPEPPTATAPVQDDHPEGERAE